MTRSSGIRRGAVSSRFFLGVSVGALFAAALAGQAGAQTLSDTLVTAYSNSPELGAQRAQVKATAERAVQVRAQGRPQVNGNARIDAANSQWSDTYFPTSLTLDLSQSIYSGGRIANSSAAAERRTTRQEALLVSTEQQVLLDAVTAFFDVRRGLAFVDLGINNVRVLTEQLRAANERFEVGEVTRTDVEQARSRLAAARSSLAAARGTLASARESYLRAVGAPPVELSPPPPLPDVPESLADAVGIALQNDPQILASRIARDAAGFDVRAAIGSLLPQLSLVAQAGRTDTFKTGGLDRRFNDGTDVAVGLAATIPIYQGGANYANVREAQAVVEQSVANITASERNTVQSVGVAWARLETARASIKAGELEVQAAKLAFQGVQEEAKVGARTTLDVLNAEQELLNARADLVQAQRDEAVATYSLLAAMGLLTTEHLGLDVEKTDVASYYQSVRDRHFGYDKSDDTVWRYTLRP